MLKKICFLVNYNLYESKRHFTEKLADALKRKGIETSIIDLEEGTLNKAEIAKIHAFKPDMTASFNSFLPISGNRYLWDMLQTPHLSMLVDPALYSVNLIDSPFSILSCVDRFDCQGLQSQQFNRIFFFPHAIEAMEEAPHTKKEYDVVFLGSCYDYESLQESWRKKLSPSMSKALEHAAEIVLGDNKTSLQEALVKAWNAHQLSIQGVDFLGLFYWLDNYTRGLDRVKLIRAIKDVPVHVFGELARDEESASKGWDYYLKGMENVTIHPAVSYQESLEILKRSKICLNSSPFFKYGSHERMFAGPMCGALVITGDNLYVREHFKEEIVLFPPSGWEEANKKVHHYLKEEQEREALVAAARKKVLAEDTWDARASLLLETLPPLLKQ